MVNKIILCFAILFVSGFLFACATDQQRPSQTIVGGVAASSLSGGSYPGAVSVGGQSNQFSGRAIR